MCERPCPGAEAGAGPEAADPAAGAAGEVGQERVEHTKNQEVNHFLFWKERKLKVREYKLISKKYHSACKYFFFLICCHSFLKEIYPPHRGKT